MTKLKTIVSMLLEEILAEAENTVQPVREPLAIDIPQDISDLSSIFQRAGYKLYLVGGAVRDALLGKTPKDYDIATDAQPDQILEILAPYNEYKTLEIGKAFGVINVITPQGEEYEVATFRRDLSGGRRPDAVEFTDIATDVMRRDLTINALFYDMSTGEVVDYVGGIEDLRNGVVKAVGDPKERFDEDRLRILRAIRFAARMGSQLDPETREAIKADNSLRGVSPERIRDEFLKGIKSAKSVPEFIAMVSDLNLWDDIFPGLQVTTTNIPNTNETILVLVQLLSSNSPERLKKQLNNLKYSAVETSQVWFLVNFQNLSVETAVDLWKINAKQVRLDQDTLINAAKIMGEPPMNLVKAFIAYEPSIGSEELIQQGFSGKELGQKIRELETERFQTLL